MTIGIALESSVGGTTLMFINQSYWAPEAPVGDIPVADSGLLASIIGWFRDLLGIQFGQGSVATDTVQAQRLCVGSVCVTEEEFMQVFGHGTGTPTLTPESTPTPSETPPIGNGSPDEPLQSPETTPEPVISTSPEATPETTEAPVPEAPTAPEATPTGETVPVTP
jgi:hypothetical protein